MEVLGTHCIKTLLIQDTLVPEFVSLSIKKSLKVLGEHHLYFTSKSLTVVERKQLEQMLLGWG